MEHFEKITIIGFGNLMESLFPYFSNNIPLTELKKYINATTADEHNIPIKKQKFGINIYFKSNIQALREMRPSIILFAPPPNMALSIIKNDISPYFLDLRKTNQILPDLYAFPPIPYIEVYQEILGKDVNIANILPNDIRTINGRRIQGEGINFCTISSSWSNIKLDRLSKYISQFGGVEFFSSAEILPILVTRVITTSFIHIYSKYIEEINDAIFSILYTSWFEGAIKYSCSKGFSKEKSEQIIKNMLNLVINLCQNEFNENLKNHIITATTKGGLLEHCISYLNSNIIIIIDNIIAGLKSGDDFEIERKKSELLEQIKNCCDSVFNHSQNLLK